MRALERAWKGLGALYWLYKGSIRVLEGLVGLAASAWLSSLSSGSIVLSLFVVVVLVFARIASSYSISLIEVFHSQSWKVLGAPS